MAKGPPRVRPAITRATVLGLLLVAVLLAGCGKKDPTGVVPEQDGDGRYVIRMTNNLRFEPAEVILPFNATVVWINAGTVKHDVAGYHGDPEKGAEREFTSVPADTGELIPPGGSFEHTFTEKGTWTILCHTHHGAGMRGTIHVLSN